MSRKEKERLRLEKVSREREDKRERERGEPERWSGIPVKGENSTPGAKRGWKKRAGKRMSEE